MPKNILSKTDDTLQLQYIVLVFYTIILMMSSRQRNKEHDIIKRIDNISVIKDNTQLTSSTINTEVELT